MQISIGRRVVVSGVTLIGEASGMDAFDGWRRCECVSRVGVVVCVGSSRVPNHSVGRARARSTMDAKKATTPVTCPYSRYISI